MIVLSHQYLLTNAKWRKWLYYSLPVTLLLVFTARAIMMIDMPPKWWIVKDEFHNNRNWVNAIKQKAGSLPVVFADSYQKPSKYWYYSGDTAMALNTTKYRRNNFNFWEIEDSLIGKPAYFVGNREPGLTDTFNNIRLENNRGKAVPLYYSFSRILIDEMKSSRIDKNKISVQFRTITPSYYLKYFQQKPFDTASVYLAIYENKKVVAYLPANLTVKDITKEEQENIVSFDLGLSPE